MGNLDSRKEILDMLYTCNGISSYPRDEIPYSDLAIHFSKIEGWYFEYRRKTKYNYDGCAEECLEKIKTKRGKLLDKMSSLETQALKMVPVPIGTEKEYKIQVSKGESKELDKVITNLYNQFRKEVGSQVYLKSIEKDIPEFWDKLEKLAKVVISLNVIDGVEDVILTDGKYVYQWAFLSSTDACNYYRDEVVDDFNAFSESDKEKLKNWFQKHVVIKNDEENQKRKSSLNKLISTWIGDERKRQKITRGRATD